MRAGNICSACSGVRELKRQLHRCVQLVLDKKHPRNDAQHSACITGRWDTIGSLCLDFNVSATVELEREYASRPDSNESDKTFLWGVALSPTKTTDFTRSFTKETVCQAWKEVEWWLSAVSVNDRASSAALTLSKFLLWTLWWLCFSFGFTECAVFLRPFLS